MKSILDPAFRYINSANTDIRKTFARVRREQEAQRKSREQTEAHITPINRRSIKA